MRGWQVREAGYDETVSTVSSKTTELGQRTWGLVKDVMTLATLKVEEYTRDEDEFNPSSPGNNGNHGQCHGNSNNANAQEDLRESEWNRNNANFGQYHAKNRWDSNYANAGDCPTQNQCNGQSTHIGWDDWGPDSPVAAKSNKTKNEEVWDGWD